MGDERVIAAREMGSESKTTERLRCRPILAEDIDGIVDLLCRGFPDRTADYWRRGLDRQAARALPEGCPRFGVVMVAGVRFVGVVLTLYAAARDPDASGPWCNLSSWYVEPEYRAYATLLDRAAMRRPATTFTNISPAPHTVPMHEARGFAASSRGQIVAFPLLARRIADVSIRSALADDPLDELPDDERRLVAEHAGYGCVALIGRDERGSQPFLFIRHPVQAVKWRLGFSPIHYLQLVYCRSTDELPRFARAIGDEMMRRHGGTCIVLDADGPLPGLPGFYREDTCMRLKRGSDRIRPGDLAYSEMVIFGP